MRLAGQRVVGILITSASLLAQTSAPPSAVNPPVSSAAEATDKAAASPATLGLIEVFTDTMGVDFDPYLNKEVLPRVKQNWYALIPESASWKKGSVVLEFSILKDGGVAGLKVVGPSGDAAMDRPAFGSITGSNPFPSLPREFDGPYVGLRLRYYYNVAAPSLPLASIAQDIRKKLHENLSKDNNAKTDLEHDVAALTKLLDAGSLDSADDAAARYFRASAQTRLNAFHNKDGLTTDRTVNEQYLSDLDHIIAGKTDLAGWEITIPEVAYTAGIIAYGLDSPRTYSYLQLCADLVPCMVDLASGYTHGWEGVQPDPAKALNLNLKAFDSGTKYRCAGAYAAHNIAWLIYFAGVSYSKDNDPVSWTQKSFGLSSQIDAHLNSENACPGAAENLAGENLVHEFLYRLAQGDRRNSLLTDALRRFGDKATTAAPALAKYLSGSLDATAFQGAVESSKSELGRCYAYFHAMWYAYLIGNTSLVNKFYEPLSKFDQATCPNYLVYAKKFRPEAGMKQPISTQH